jgi:hypothetical protein
VDSTGRDLGLRRVSRLTRWSVAAAVVLTGVLSALVAHARPGQAKASSISTGPNSNTNVSPNPGDNFLQPPSTGAPSLRSGGGLVNSGAS